MHAFIRAVYAYSVDSCKVVTPLRAYGASSCMDVSDTVATVATADLS
jgi:hypothetical protein